MELYLRDDFSELWQGKDPFVEVEKLQGKVYRELEGRSTLRFELNDKAYFVKIHRGVGWFEIIKNLLQLRLPILGAANEYHAVNCLQALGVGTMSVAAYGCKEGNPAAQHSFIITDAIEPSISLEDLAKRWQSNKPNAVHKRVLIAQVAEMARRMHAKNINHRDFYICHFLLSGSELTAQPKLSLIDLHRALIHRHLPYRWLLKDLAGLYYSAFDAQLTRRDFYRFIKGYRQQSLREVFAEENNLWLQVENKAKKLYARAVRKGIV